MVAVTSCGPSTPANTPPASTSDKAWGLSAVNALFCTALPVWLVMRGVQLVGATMASQVGMVGPLSTIFMGIWILGEPFTLWLAVGTCLVVAGIFVFTRLARKAAVG